MTTNSNQTIDYSALTNDKLKIVAFSDSHTNHPKLPVDKNLYGIKKTIERACADPKQVDMLICAGDLFDRDLAGPSIEQQLITEFLQWLVGFCLEYDIVLRLLEGTPSHDRQQGYLLERIAGNTPLDFKYVKTLSIEHNERFGIDILYLPDEWTTDCQRTQALVEALLIDHGLSTVHVTVMHGMFEFQAPAHVDIDTHDESFYQHITTMACICGHVHRPIKRGVIIVPGSTIRFCHGEEEAKGLWSMVFYRHGGSSFKFHENLHAVKFLDLDLTGLTDEAAIEKASIFGSTLPPGSYVRPIYDQSLGNNLTWLVKSLKQTVPGVNWSPPKNIAKLGDAEKPIHVVKTKKDIDVTDITRDNIISLVKDRVGDHWTPTHESCLLECV